MTAFRQILRRAFPTEMTPTSLRFASITSDSNPIHRHRIGAEIHQAGKPHELLVGSKRAAVVDTPQSVHDVKHGF